MQSVKQPWNHQCYSLKWLKFYVCQVTDVRSSPTGSVAKCVVNQCSCSECRFKLTLTSATWKMHLNSYRRKRSLSHEFEVSSKPSYGRTRSQYILFLQKVSLSRVADATLDLAYRPFSASYRPHPPPITCRPIRRADNGKRPFMNSSSRSVKGL